MPTPFTSVGDFFRKLYQEDTASPTEPATTSTSGPPLSVEGIKTEAEALSYMLKMFFSGWGHMPELRWFQLLIGSTPQALDRLAVELNAFSRPRDGGSYVYRRPAPAKGDPEWLDKLQKAQDGVARPAVAAALLKELFPRAERLQTSCEKMLKMSKGQPASMDGALRLSVEGLKSLVEFTPNRRSSEATGRRAHQDCHYDESA